MDELNRPDEAAIEAQRKAKFGALPPRLRPDDLVGLVETRSAEDRPASATSEAQQIALTAGG
ncbi:hypothetical protein AB0F72_05895 [Actinoplanes sp. NPDC023936]|uniref:hypothetical protein n=1 Tax=Actinoplanes sp. NPDC023936 TaxID=3154910 RepID=UPI0034052DA7